MNAEKIKELRGLVVSLKFKSEFGDTWGTYDTARAIAQEVPALLDEVEALSAYVSELSAAAHRMADAADMDERMAARSLLRYVLAARHEPTKSPTDLKDAE